MNGDGFLSPWEAIPFFQPIVEKTWTVFPPDNKIVTANPMRVALIFSANGTQPVRVSTRSDVSTSSGILVPANGNPLEIKHADYGYLVQVEWYGVPSGAGGTLCVVEVMLSSWPGESSNAKVINPADIKRAAMAYARARQAMSVKT